MKCFGDKTKTFHCKVVLLDEQELIQEVQETTGGQDLLDVVFQHLNLIETSYFGLRYIDPSNQTHWLDPNKRLVKQLKGISPFTLYFSVKFYAADPTKLVEEITRYQFFLQIKQDILQGRLPVSTELAAELGSLAVQSELGDYDPRRHSPGYVSEFRFVANQSVALEAKIAELHKKLVSYVPSKAELCYLEKVKWLDMYGVDLHPVLGEDSTEYFLGLTPSGIIVLRNKVKVGNYFWPRITKVYFKGRFFMLRVKDKNNGENTYGFETPSKSACKHLWQCCVEHHAFFRLTQAAGNNPQAMVSLGNRLRNSGRAEKDVNSEAKVGARPQTEFARTPSRRYQRRIVEGAQDTPRTEENELKPETRTIVSLPGTVTPVSHVYRSTSMTLAPRSDSPRSTRSAPYPSGLQRQAQILLGNQTRREGRPWTRGESPRSVKSASASRATEGGVERVPRRTSSVESQSSADSRSCNRSCSRHRRSRCRSSDGESEASSKCSSSKGHRRHHHHRHHHRRHRHNSDDSTDHHKHRHRRHRHRSNEKQEPQMIESSDQWARVQNGSTPSRSNTATVRDLTNGYMPSGHDDTEADAQGHQHSSRRKYRKHRSPSDSKQQKNYPDEIRRHIEFNLQNTEGLTEAQLREIPYTKVETAKTVKIKYGSPKGKRHKSPKRTKSNSSERKSHQESIGNCKENMNDCETDLINGPDKRTETRSAEKDQESKTDTDNKLPNGSIRPCPRSSQTSAAPVPPHSGSAPLDDRATSQRSSPTRGSSPLKSCQEVGILPRRPKETSPNSSPPIFGPKPSISSRPGPVLHQNTNGRYSYPNHSNHNSDDQNTFKTCNYVTSNYNSTSENSQSQSQRPNLPSDGAFPPLLRDSSLLMAGDPLGYPGDPVEERHQQEEELNNGFIDSNGGGFMSQCPTLLKNATLERGSHFTAVLKPQPSPQSSVTSGISVGSSSASTTVAETSEGESHKFHTKNDLPYSQYQGICNNEMVKNFSYGQPNPTSSIRNGLNGISKNYQDNFTVVKQSNSTHGMMNGHPPPLNHKMNNVENGRIHSKDGKNMKFYSAFEEVRRHFEGNSDDRGYHTIEKSHVGSSVNFRNNYNLSQDQKLAKERPNSFTYTQRLNGTTSNNEYNPNAFEKYNTFYKENPRIFKPILKSFASEDSLNTQTNTQNRSKSTEQLDNVSTFSNNKGRVRWNIQEKTKNIINMKDDNSYYKPRDYNSLNKTKPNNIHNVKNDVVYAGKGEIIKIKNNQIINIKTASQPMSKTFKKENNAKGISSNKGFIRDEISTEL